MKRVKAPDAKATEVDFYPVIGRAGLQELIMLRNLEHVISEILDVKRAVFSLIMKHNVIDAKDGLGLNVDLNTGEIRRHKE